MLQRVLYGAAVAIAVALFGLAFLAAPPKVRAAEAPSKAEWYERLRQPVTGRGCCSEADCARTPANYRDGAWWVPPAGRIVAGTWVDPPAGAWVRVPDRVILAETEPQDGVSAYACWVGGEVFCFVRPGSGG